MTAATATAAAENTRRKATVLARYAWRLGLSPEDLQGLPYASRNRNVPTKSRLARAAYADAGVDENVPSDRPNGTWSVAVGKLGEGYERLRAGKLMPPQDLMGERSRWIPEGVPDPEPPAPPPPTAPEPARTGLPPLPVEEWPPGWAELAELPPLTYGQCVHHPDRRPVIITPDGGRCGDCPPRPAEFPTSLHDQEGRPTGRTGYRDGWGHRRPGRPGGPQSLNWTPKPCKAPDHCRCGRCPAKEKTT